LKKSIVHPCGLLKHVICWKPINFS